MKCARMLVVILICVGITVLGPGSVWAQEPQKLPTEPHEIAAQFVEGLVRGRPGRDMCYRVVKKLWPDFIGSCEACMVADLDSHLRQPQCAARLEERSSRGARVQTQSLMVLTALPSLSVKLVRVGEAWRVDLLSTWKAATGKSEESLHTEASMSDLKQLALAGLMYAQDFDEYFPPANKWCDVLEPYVRNESLFHCPAVPFDQYGYAFNKNLAGLSREDIQFPAQTVVFFESTLGTRNATGTGESLPDPPRHPEGNIFGFADGHVQQIMDPETYVIWKP